VLRALLATCTTHTWKVHSLAIVSDRSGYGEEGGPLVAVALTLTGPGVGEATAILGTVEGVGRVDDGHIDDE
jgi:putative Mg2+ transporter-C (MgtC) family protein